MLKPLSIKSLSMNEKGQAYSAFKLLIAAIIAMAILGILVPIIMQVMGLIKNNPTDKTVSLLSELVDKPGTLKYAKDVSFDDANPTLSGTTLAEKTAVASDQICMDLGEFSTDSSFTRVTSTTQHIITYTGSGKVVDLAVICNSSKAALIEDIDAYVPELLTMPEPLSLDCDLCGVSGDCCAIILQR